MLSNGSYHFMGRELVRIEHVSASMNEIVITNLSKLEKQLVDYDRAVSLFQPAYKIGDVARLLARKPDTIRKWEYRGITEPQSKWLIGNKEIRFYSLQDIKEMRDDVAGLHRGRPRKDGRITSNIPPASEIKKYIKERMRNV